MNATVIAALDTLADTEAAISAVHANAAASLQIPKDSIRKYRGAMIDASRLQLLVTWARNTSDPYLDFHEANRLEYVLSDLCACAPGIAALRLCEGVRVGGGVVLRRAALAGAAKKMQETDAGHFSEIINGRTIDMTCVSGMKLQYLRPLFSERSPDAVKDEEGIKKVIDGLFDIINKVDRDLVSDSFVNASSIFTSELFKNTQQHAVTDHRGKPYDAHVEGLIVSWIEMEDRLFSSDFRGHPRLSQFWDREQVGFRGGQAKGLRCLQLSFFDSGPGFAGRATGLNVAQLDRQRERDQLIHCLKKNVTTTGKIGAGQGLPSVLTELQAIGGLIRIRSGRHSIFNCFTRGEESDIFNFDDWTAQPLDPVAGSVISLLVPLRRS